MCSVVILRSWSQPRSLVDSTDTRRRLTPKTIGAQRDNELKCMVKVLQPKVADIPNLDIALGTSL